MHEFSKRMKKPLIIIAPDKFKGTLSSLKAATIIKNALSECGVEAIVKIIEMADGGEGSAKLLSGKNHKRVFYDAEDCGGRKIRAAVWVDQMTGTAYIDSAEVIGMKRRGNLSTPVKQRTSYTLGILLKQLIEEYTNVGLAVGGTATVDGGAGMMQALGAIFTLNGTICNRKILLLDFSESHVECDWSGVNIDQLRKKMTVYVDVDVPLIAPPGHPSSLMFAKQKGVTDINALKNELLRYSALLPDGTHSGAGGGLASALGAFGIKIKSGAETLCERIESLIATQRPDLIITGEGSIDAQSFEGKVVGTLYEICAKHRITMLAIGGICDIALAPRHGLKTVATIEKPLKSISAAQAADNLKIATTKAFQEMSSLKF